MYKNLKFSWAHIFAFLALISIGYVVYVGLVYDLDSGFAKPAYWMSFILAVLIIWFIGAQQLKGVNNDFNFRRCIWWERILLFTTPFVFIVCMIPFNHAMNVASKSQVIEEKFRNAVTSSRQMFEEYDSYSTQRIDKYENALKRLRLSISKGTYLYKEVITSGTCKRYSDIELRALTRQLRENYIHLDTLAQNWIDLVDKRTSVWNVFLVGNIKGIEKAIMEWNSSLKEFSNVVFSTENTDSEEVSCFDSDQELVNSIISDLNSLRDIYNPDHSAGICYGNGINSKTVIFGVVLYLLLLLPYIIQDRNGVSTYKLFGRRRTEGSIDISQYDPPVLLETETDDELYICDRTTVVPVDGNETNVWDNAFDNSFGNADEYMTKEERRRRRQARREERRNAQN